jgi:ABC-type sugar transport system substrate-binding protein
MTSRLTHWARRLPAAAALTLCAIAANAAYAADPVKIGFLVKQAEEPWFQDEWRYAEQAARDKGFSLVKIGIPNGEKMIAAIDNLAAQKAQGFVICAPDVKLGAAVARAAKRNNMKVISVDDRLVDDRDHLHVVALRPVADRARTHRRRGLGPEGGRHAGGEHHRRAPAQDRYRIGL